MFSNVRSTLRRRSTLVAAGTVVLVALGGGATAASAAPAAGTPSTSSTSCAPTLRAVLRGGMPAQLRTDLKALSGAPKAQRAADRAAIRKKALAGAYGARVERLAAIVAGKGSAHAWVQALPAALRSDLKALHALKPTSAERKAKAQAIVAKALSGGYGTVLQQRAQRAQQRCAAKQG